MILIGSLSRRIPMPPGNAGRALTTWEDGKVYNGVLYVIAVDGSTNDAYLGMWGTSDLHFIRSINLAEVDGWYYPHRTANFCIWRHC